MAKLNAARRNALPGKDFAGPDRSYPVEDASHARNALARVAQHGSPAEKAEVRRKVHAKFPGIGEKEKPKMEGRKEREGKEHEREGKKRTEKRGEMRERHKRERGEMRERHGKERGGAEAHSDDKGRERGESGEKGAQRWEEHREGERHEGAVKRAEGPKRREDRHEDRMERMGVTAHERRKVRRT